MSARKFAVRHATPLAIAAATVVFAALVWHHRWMSDDGLIFTRTVRNILAGNGPVVNASERAEACTSVLWPWLLALVGWIPSVDLARLAVYLGGLLAIGGFALAMDATRRLYSVRSGNLPIVPAAAFMVLGMPPFWDYATSGLEGGLGTAWIAASWWLFVTLPPDAGRARRTVTAIVLGLGPLVRPDFAIVTVVFSFASARIARIGWRSALALGAAALALPLAYEIVRAGYFGTLVPLPALAKSAGAEAWDRGIAYAGDYARPYHLWLPLGVLAAILGVALARRTIRDRELIVTATPIVAGIAHALFVIRVGGDFMHARLLLPSTLLVVLPALVLPARRIVAPALALLAVWAIVIAVARDNRRTSHGGATTEDERLGYIGVTHDKHPVTAEAFVEAADPTIVRAIEALRAHRHRFVDQVMDLELDGAVAAPVVLSCNRLGTCGAALPLDGFAADVFGLANPLGARITRTLPRHTGHEKALPSAWLVAEFANDAGIASMLGDPSPGQIAAARHAMSCGALAELRASVLEPMTLDRFWRNLTGAFARTTLVVPADPFVAEREFCTTS
jgi:arabinofuranosyltransferase